MTYLRHYGLGIALLGLGISCGPHSQDDTSGGGDGGTQATSSESTSGASASTTTPPPGTTTGADGTQSEGIESGVLFLADPDVNTPPTCDVFEQDCFDGFKCVPFSEGGGGWTGLACFPVNDGAAAPGEPCTTLRFPWSGYDDCDATSVCWVSDETTLEGSCFALCIGSADAPTCADPDAVCSPNSDGVGLCLPPCSALEQDCPTGQGCYPSQFDTFVCMNQAQAGTSPPGQICELPTECDLGSTCLAADQIPGCLGSGCCSSLCDLDDPMPSCLPGQSCQPWFSPGTAPAGQQNVGACGVAP